MFMRDKERKVEGVYGGQGREDVYEGQEEGRGCL